MDGEDVFSLQIVPFTLDAHEHHRSIVRNTVCGDRRTLVPLNAIDV